MIETLLGTVFGGVFRMAPEVLKWLDRKNERSHELAMFDKQIQADTLRAQANLRQAEVEAEGRIGVEEIRAIVSATQAQGKKTGIKWVDAINSLMRPTITFWWVIVMYSAALAAQFIVLREGGLNNVQSILYLWGPDEKAICASIISFWFVDRSLRKGGGVGAPR